MKSRGLHTASGAVMEVSDTTPTRLGFVAEPRNRRERRARQAQERAARRAISRGEQPAIFLDLALKQPLEVT